MSNVESMLWRSNDQEKRQDNKEKQATTYRVYIPTAHILVAVHNQFSSKESSKKSIVDTLGDM